MRFTRWDQTANKVQTHAIIKELALFHAHRIGDVEAKERLVELVSTDDYLGLCDFELDYASVSVWDAINIRQVCAFFSKRADIEIDGVSKLRTGVVKFIEAEQLCRQTNDIIRLWRVGDFSFPSGVESKLLRAQQKIATILGGVPKLSAIKPRFGPGATTQIPKRIASARRKLSMVHACSEDLFPVLKDCLEELQSWLDYVGVPQEGKVEFLPPLMDFVTFGSQLSVINGYSDEDPREYDTYLYESFETYRRLYLELCEKHGLQPSRSGDLLKVTKCSVPVEIHPGKLAFVPKSAKTFRAVVVEPSLNSMFQLGIGDYMAARLRRFGVDISDQSLNQRLAREGSLSGALATLDLSSASDTIALELVYMLLPVDWALFLAKFRTGKISYEGVDIRLEKFSSMGNGFTFPLETLIFYALACACANENDVLNVNAYGDDIIVPTYCYGELCELLRCVGFITNKSKSFADGPFRESCGADYLSGIDIRPSYIKDALSGFDLFRLHNQYARRGEVDAANLVLTFLDPTLQRWGPDGYGDGHLISKSSGHREGSSYKRDLGWSGYTFETYTFKARRDFTVLPGDSVYPSYCTYLGGEGALQAESEVIPPDTVPYQQNWDGPEGTRWKLELERLAASRPRRALISITHRELLRASAIAFREKSSPAHAYSRDGYLGVSVPGVRGCKSIKIYTLS